MLKKPNLNRTAQSHVNELRNDYGIDPTLDEILWLHELGKRVENPIGEVVRSGIPVKAGNVYLWPMTIMASAWFNDKAVVWFRGSDHILRYCLAFALVYGRGKPLPPPRRPWFSRFFNDAKQPMLLSDLVDRDQAYHVVKRWAAGLQCRVAEMDAAIDAVLDDPGCEDENDDETPPACVDLEEVAQNLAILTGTDPAYWQWKTGRRECIRAYLRAVSTENARRGERSAPVRDAVSAAIADMRSAMQRIIKDHSGKKSCAVK